VTLKVIEGHRKWRDLIGHISLPISVNNNVFILVEFRGDLWYQQARLTELSCGFVCVILCLAVLVEHRLVTDTDTDRHTRTQAHG